MRRWLVSPVPALAMLVALTGAYTFFATAGTWQYRDLAGAYFDALGAAFLRGQMYLPVTPPPALLALANPYDPAARSAVTPNWPWDASLYHGRFYLYWGPAPAMLHALWHLRYSTPLLEGRFGVLIGIATCVVFWFILVRLRSRALPHSPPWLVWGSLLAFGLGGMMPYLVGRPSVYHSPILLALLGLLGALFCLAEAVDSRNRRHLLLFLSGVLLGLAVASRATYLAYAIGVTCVICLGFVRSGTPAGHALKDLTAFAAPLIVTGLVLLAYNWARFDSPFEFGTQYQLAGTDQTHSGLTCGNNVVGYFGLYFLSVPRLMAAYPFITFASGPALSFASGFPVVFPPGRFTVSIPIEPPIMSVFLLVPIGLLIVSAPFLRRSAGMDAGAWAVVLAAVVGMMATTASLTCANGVDARYFGDLAAPLCLAGTIVLLVWSDRFAAAGFTSWRRALYAFAGAAWVSSIAIGVLLGTVAWLYWAPQALNQLFSKAPGP